MLEQSDITALITSSEDVTRPQRCVKVLLSENVHVNINSMSDDFKQAAVTYLESVSVPHIVSESNGTPSKEERSLRLF